MFAAAASAITGIEDGDEDEDMLKVGETALHAAASGSRNRRSAVADTASRSTTTKPKRLGGESSAGPLKPRARDVQRYLAAAVSMAGDDVDDFLLAQKKDAEEVPTRERLKRSTRVQVRQAAAAAITSTPPTGSAGGASSTGAASSSSAQ